MSQQTQTNVPQTQQQQRPRKQQNGGDKQGKPKKDGFKNKSRGGFQNKQNVAGGEKKKNTKTIFVAKIFLDDLDNTANENLSRHLKGQRIKYLRDTLASFGDIERIEHSEEQQNVHVTYVERKSALEALKNLRNKDKLDELVAGIKNQLNQSKLPEACAPKLLLYRYGWADNVATTKAPKNVYKQSNEAIVAANQQPKNVVAQQPQPQQPVKDVVAKPAKPAESAEGKKEKKVKETKKKEKQVIESIIEEDQNIMSEEQRRAATDTLRREAEIAKLKEDKNYLNKQQSAIFQELNAERERVKDRETRIGVLLSDLDRVNQEKQRLEEQLAAEQSWKKKGEETINKLEEEMKHIDQQYQQNEVRLKQVSALRTSLSK